MMNFLQEALIQILSETTSLIVLIVLMVFVFLVRETIKKLLTMVNKYMEKKLTSDQQTIVKRIAEIVFSNIEAKFKELDGPDKMKLAVSEAKKILAAKNIKLEEEEIIATINNAWFSDKRIEQQIKAMAGLKIDKILESTTPTEGVK